MWNLHRLTFLVAIATVSTLGCTASGGSGGHTGPAYYPGASSGGASSGGVGPALTWGPTVLTRQFYKEGAWSPGSRTRITYEGGRVTEMRDERFTDGRWVPKNKRWALTYDGAGRVSVYTEWRIPTGWSTWFEAYRARLVRGADGKLVSIINERQQTRDKGCEPIAPTSCAFAWHKRDRWDYSYDSAGHIVEIKKINNIEQEALPSYKCNWTWTTTGMPDLRTESRFEAGKWNEAERTAYTYDGDGRLLMALTYDQQDAGTWQENARRQYSYVAGNRVKEIARAWYDGEAWKNEGRRVFAYDASGRLLSTNSFGAGSTNDWEPEGRVTLEHGTTGSSWTADHLPPSGNDMWLDLKLDWYGQMSLYSGQ